MVYVSNNIFFGKLLKNKKSHGKIIPMA